MTRGEIRTEILVRSGKDTTSAWTSEAILNDWVNQAHRWTGGYKPWVFTEGRTSTTWAATEEWSFEGYKADSFRLLQVGGKRLTKLNFEDYQIFREEEPSSDERVFSDFGRLLFINPNIDLSGTLTAWGQYIPADIPDGDGADSDETVFTPNGDEGNQAIIEEVLSYISDRDMRKQEAQLQHEKAKLLLEELWKRTLDEQYKYQTHPDSGGMFKRFNVLKGGIEDEIFKRDQFN